jgi:acyl-homoserine-lactone acylase
VAPEPKLRALVAAVDRLERDFGSWRTPWGEINRFQRLTGDIAQPFNDTAPSIPVGFTSGAWGSLASFGAGRHNGSKRYYGVRGNSFVAAVEFGPRIRARAVSAGGQSGDPRSPHFNDQAERYADRQPARGLLLPRRAAPPHRTRVSAGAQIAWPAAQPLAHAHWKL